MYATIVADPPWPYAKGPKKNGFSSGAYRPMPISAIHDLPQARWADANAHLYLWVPCTFMEAGLQTVTAWGFRYITMLTWVKCWRSGMGRYFQTNSEHILFGVRGRLRTTKLESSVFFAPVGKHSEKPDEFYRIVERQSPAPRIDLFARRQRHGWTCWGDELCRWDAKVDGSH